MTENVLPEQVIGFIGHPDAGVTSIVHAVEELAPAPTEGPIGPPIGEESWNWTLEFIAGQPCWIGPVKKN